MTQFILFLLLGLGVGGGYALLALGVVLVYRGSGVLNFAHGGIAVFGLAVYYQVYGALGTVPSLVVAVIASALVGVVIQAVIMRPLRGASPLVRVVATLALLIAIQEAGLIRYGGVPVFISGIFPQNSWHLFSGVTIGVGQMYTLALTVMVGVVLWAVYRWTRFGIATTAVAENQRATAALGWSPNRVGMGNWAIGGGLAGLAGCVLGPITGLDPVGLSLAIIPALAACLVGGFASFPLTLCGGLLVGMLESLTTRYVSQPGWSSAVPFVVIVAVLVLRGRPLPLRGERSERLPTIGTGQLRPVATVGVAALVLASLVVFGANWSDAVIAGGIAALICLSLVVLTGYCGQLSLAQFALAGVGALAAGRLADVTGAPFLVSTIVGVAAAMVVGTLVALPAIRVRGVNLAVTTMGLSVVIASVVLANPQFTGGTLLGTVVQPPSLFGWSIYSVDHPQRYAGVVVVLVAGCAVATANLRRGRIGRRLVAVRGNERAAASLGIGVPAAKLYAFVLSAAFAGLAGALLAFQQTHVLYDGYAVQSSITALIYALLGGVGYVAGALFGGVSAQDGPVSDVISHWVSTGDWYLLVAALLLIVALIANPNGAIGEFVRLRRTWRRRASRPRSAWVLSEQEILAAHPLPLVVSDLSVRFGGVQAVRDVSLTVQPGQIVGLIGPNGAGKTTVIDAISGFLAGYSGTVTLGGRRIDRLGASGRARAGVGRCFQSLELFEDLTVAENLRAAADPPGTRGYLVDLLRPDRRSLPPAAAMTVRDFGLEGVLDRLPSELPYAVRRLVAVARSVAASPAVLMLDEPAAGLDEASTRELAQLIRRVADERGVGVLLVEHDVPLVMSISDRIEVLDFGRLIASGDPDYIRAHPDVVAAYLGDGHRDRSAPATDAVAEIVEPALQDERG
jgi:ABC-type branched-subunit amino acid transport system ATPase component/branched-subunit amino acid ABC-type transport system permease component